jgi:two-component system sensor histidine kinase HupT/HoxJ
MSDVLVVCGPDGGVRRVNPAFADLTGWAAADVVGQPLEALFADGDTGALVAFSQRPSAAGLRACAVRLRRAGGGATDVLSVDGAPCADPSGRPLGAVLIGRPAGDRGRSAEGLAGRPDTAPPARRARAQHDKMASLGRLVSGVAHELNNPISFVNGNVHVLDRYCRRIRAYVEAVHHGVTGDDLAVLRESLRIDHALADLPDLIAGTLEGTGRVTEIVTSLRRLSFAQAAPAEPFDLGEVVRTAVLWTAHGDGAAARVAVDLGDNLEALGNGGQIQQVVTNLVQNALDATAGRPGGAVRVVARRLGGRIRLTVSDTGPGIPEDQMRSVFDPFFTTKAVGEGTGLGLWISYGLVRDHGGTLSVANGPQGGAVFTADLPAS